MYNFEQAVEGLAHGIPVKRNKHEEVYITKAQKGYYFNVWVYENNHWVFDDGCWKFDLDDFYATDWIDASEVVS